MSQFYPKFKQALLEGNINLSASVVKAVIVDNTYTFDAAHEFLSDILGTAQEAISSAITTKTFLNGVMDGDDIIFVDLTSDPIVDLVLFVDTGNPATSRLIVNMDAVVTPTGTTVTFAPHANGFFAL